MLWNILKGVCNINLYKNYFIIKLLNYIKIMKNKFEVGDDSEVMNKNNMKFNKDKFKFELVKIEKDSELSGVVTVLVDGKKVEVLMHESGEIDLEADWVADGEGFDDDLYSGIIDFVNTHEDVMNAFPADEYW